MSTRLEHANLAVHDVDATLRFLQTAFPDFRIRGEGKNWQGARWVHIGNDETYVAVNEAPEPAAEQWVPYAGKPGTNHLGYVVDDVDALRARMLSVGYRDSTVPNNHPHRRRVYFYDTEGNDWEFVQYLTEAVDERNDYALPDLT
jgi:catechol 2,3-dioxygenase-like lactoylglutathione lyase family enzyme